MRKDIRIISHKKAQKSCASLWLKNLLREIQSGLGAIGVVGGPGVGAPKGICGPVAPIIIAGQNIGRRCSIGVGIGNAPLHKMNDSILDEFRIVADRG